MGPTANIIPRACRNCRIRKIRCNREVPCSNCITSNILCEGTSKSVAQHSPAAHTTSPDPTHDRLQDRVAALEHMVSRLSEQQNVTASINATPLASNKNIQLVSLEGATSFGKQSIFASEVTELKSPVATHSAHVLNGISNLRKVLENEDDQRDTPMSSSPHDSFSVMNAEIPPSEFVLRLLRALSGKPYGFLIIFHPVPDYKILEDLCRKVYFPVEPVSLGEITLLNALLNPVLSELKRFAHPGISVEEAERWEGVCSQNLKRGIESYEVNAIPTYEHALLLSMTALISQTEGKLALQWRYASTAARHCLALGYHREEVVAAMPPDEATKVRLLFWFVYFLDRSLVLTLGRAPALHDYDIDVEPSPISQDPRQRPWSMALHLFLEYTRIQAQIYESLYSPGSRKQGSTERQAIVNTLSLRLHQWHETWYQVDSSQVYYKSVFDHMFGPLDVGYYSTLTILYRGVNPSRTAKNVSPACFEAAKKGLETGTEVYSRYQHLEKDSLILYGVWVHVNSSFTPYVVTFLHCVAECDAEDLRILKLSLDILESISKILDACKRTYEVCKCLYNIAEAYISSQRTLHQDQTTPEDNVVVLPLQQPMDGAWMLPENDLQSLSSALQAGDWGNPTANHFSLALDSNIGNFFFNGLS